MSFSNIIRTCRMFNWLKVLNFCRSIPKNGHMS